MAAHIKPIEDTLRWEIYCEYKRWSYSANTVCNSHVFWKKVLPLCGYGMARGTFAREWNRLIKEDHLLSVEPLTGAIIIMDLQFVPKDIAEKVKLLDAA